MTSNEDNFAIVRSNVVTRGVVSIMGGAACTYFGYKYLPLPVPEVNGVADQLVYAMRWQMPAVGLVLYYILDVASARRNTGVVDPVAGQKEPESLTVRRSVLQNTIEQLLLHSPSMLVLATYLRPDQLKLIPLLSCLFVVGRLWYRAGYIDPSNLRTNRANGFALSIIPTGSVIAYNLYRLLLSFF